MGAAIGDQLLEWDPFAKLWDLQCMQENPS